MAAIVPLPPVPKIPKRAPRVTHEALPVPVIPLPKAPAHHPVPVKVHPAGKAPKTHIPIGFTRPILCSPHSYVEREYMG